MLRPTRGGRAALRPIVDRRRDAGRLGEPSVPIAVRNAQAPIVHRPIVNRHSSIVPSSKSASSPLPLIPSPSREGTGAGFYRRRHSPAPIVNRPSSKNQQPQTNNRHFRT